MNNNSKYGVHRQDFPSDREYHRAYMKAFRRTPEGKRYMRQKSMREKGLTEERYQEMLTIQGGKRAVCGTTDPGGNRWGRSESFCVDHDQNCCPGEKTCGKCIRGLLCVSCNRAEGMIKGNGYRLIEYKDRHAIKMRAWEAVDKREALLIAHGGASK